MRHLLESHALVRVVLAALLVFPASAVACEPLPPLLVLVVVPSLITGTGMGSLGCVGSVAVGLGVKCAASTSCEPALQERLARHLQEVPSELWHLIR
jgi:hypothetical protein